MNNRIKFFKFKNYFRNLNFYTLPVSILLIVRKRLNLVYTLIFFALTVVFSII